MTYQIAKLKPTLGSREASAVFRDGPSASNLLALPFKSKSQLEAENVAPRHQVVVLQRQVRGRVRLTNLDRLLLVQFYYRWFPLLLKALAIVQPETAIRWHRAGFCGYWRWKFRTRGGRPAIEAKLRTLSRNGVVVLNCSE